MIELRELSIEDLEFLLEIRNDDSTRVNLENDTIFDIDNCTKWFLTTKPIWYIILNNGEKVGYLRTNGDEVGCDIHPKHRRKGYARLAYNEYLKDKNYATLWVFEDNFAKNLYESLGFIKTEKTKIIRNRNYIEMKYFKNRTCYIINFWLGNRRYECHNYKDDRLYYLKEQIKNLTKFDHNLSKIVFNFNFTEEDYQFVTDIFKIIPNKIQNSDVEVNFRKNYGMSYGAFSDVYSKNIDKYDYFIFNEDDYSFIVDNWDKYLINKFNTLDNCGYLCMIKFDTPKPHGAHSTGISSNEILKKVYDVYGELPHSKDSDYGQNEIYGQINQTNCIFELGYNIFDVKDEYKVRFINHIGKEIIFHSENKNELIIPL
jgi:hypothetical protein